MNECLKLKISFKRKFVFLMTCILNSNIAHFKFKPIVFAKCMLIQENIYFIIIYILNYHLSYERLVILILKLFVEN